MTGSKVVSSIVCRTLQCTTKWNQHVVGKIITSIIINKEKYSGEGTSNRFQSCRHFPNTLESSTLPGATTQK